MPRSPGFAASRACSSAPVAPPMSAATEVERAEMTFATCSRERGRDPVHAGREGLRLARVAGEIVEVVHAERGHRLPLARPCRRDEPAPRQPCAGRGQRDRQAAQGPRRVSPKRRQEGCRREAGLVVRRHEPERHARPQQARRGFRARADGRRDLGRGRRPPGERFGDGELREAADHLAREGAGDELHHALSAHVDFLPHPHRWRRLVWLSAWSGPHSCCRRRGGSPPRVRPRRR